MFLLRLCILCVFVILVEPNKTIIRRRNVLLSRKKRYLLFPVGSNFGISFAAVSGFLQVQPRGWNMLYECDFPFALPTDTRLFKFHKLSRRNAIERNEIFSGLESAFTSKGLDGKSCVNRIICESKRLKIERGKSLVKDILSTVFQSEEADFGIDYENVCDKVNFEKCPIPFLDFIVTTMTRGYSPEFM